MAFDIHGDALDLGTGGTFSATTGRGGSAEVRQTAEQEIGGHGNVAMISQDATARGGQGGLLSMDIGRHAGLSVSEGGDIRLETGAGGGAMVTQIARQGLDGVDDAAMITQEARAVGGGGGRVALRLEEGAAVSVTGDSALIMRGGHGGTAFIRQNTRQGAAGVSTSRDVAQGRTGGTAALALGADAAVAVEDGSRFTVSGGHATSGVHGGTATVEVGAGAEISVTGESGLGIEATAGRHGNARLALGDAAFVGLRDGSALTIAGAGPQLGPPPNIDGNSLALGDEAALTLADSRMDIRFDSLDIGTGTWLGLQSADADFQRGQATIEARREGDPARLRIQGDGEAVNRVSVDTSLVLGDGLDTEIVHATLRVGDDLVLHGDLVGVGGAIEVDNHFSMSAGHTHLTDTTVETGRLTVGDGRELVVHAGGGDPLQWSVRDFHVVGGSGGLLDVGTTRLDIGEQATFRLGSDDASGGELRTSLFLDGEDALAVGRITADRVIVEAGAALSVQAGELDNQAIWQALAEEGAEMPVIAGVEGSEVALPETFEAPESRLFFFDLEARDHALVVLGGTSNGAAQLIGQLDLSPPAQPVLGSLFENAGWFGPGAFHVLDSGSDDDLRLLAEQVTADTTGARQMSALHVYGLMGPALDRRFRILEADRENAGYGDLPRLASVGHTPVVTADVHDGSLAGARDGAWAQIFASRADQGRRDGVSGYDMDTFGLSVGADRWINSDVVLGLAFTYGSTDVDFKGDRHANDLDVDSFVVTHYGGMFPTNEAWFLHWQASLGRHEHRDTRFLAGPGDRQRASYSGHSLHGRLTGGYDMPVGETGTLTPFTRLTASHVSVNSFRFGGEIERREDPDSIARVEPEIGVRMAGEMAGGDSSTLRLRGGASVGYDLVRDESSANLTFVDSAEPVHIPGVKQAGTTIRANAGVDLVNRSGLTISVDYAGAFRSDFRDHTAGVRARYRY
ncbi:autotransporter outer membrane beta-barrel domain-containing protein [Thioalkalivibrio thiocyanodenitrificans]|uniref:autotransporter outer membrane beta-barrel domain-containing protein n=1 Tax=Thioalkalivibrio thiocyanodenitrificans TaxID=243063 RepID=UPI00035E5D5F|nr:autotransporter outer membrane beta-barrel domain-containing protein [Thioalkalivibrio thiocyanodenitrificans]